MKSTTWACKGFQANWFFLLDFGLQSIALFSATTYATPLILFLVDFCGPTWPLATLTAYPGCRTCIFRPKPAARARWEHYFTSLVLLDIDRLLLHSPF